MSEIPVGTRVAAVLGAGTMGQGIAAVLRVAGLEVVLADVDAEHAAAAKQRMVDRAGAYADAGLRTSAEVDAIATIRTAPEPVAAVAGVQLVCETVPEDREVKRDVLSAVSAVVAPDVVIATNTSSYPIDELATAVEHPDRFLGLHWFNPAEWVPGVEVIPGTRTASGVVDACVQLLRTAGKRPVTVASSPGFIANRLQSALFAEALACVDEGLATPEAVDEVVRTTFGFRLPHYGPFQIADMAGLDVYAAVFETLRSGVGERFAPPAPLLELVDRGRFGTKSGAGFRTYDEREVERMHHDRDARYAATSRFLERLDPDGPTR